MATIYHGHCARCKKSIENNFLTMLCEPCYEKETREREEDRVLKRKQAQILENMRDVYLTGYEEGYNDCFGKSSKDMKKADGYFKEHVRDDTFKPFR